MQWLVSLVKRSPKQAMVAGKTLFLVGSILILAAMFVRAGQAGAVPQFIAWLVPEGPLGFVLTALLVLAGLALILLAEKAEKARKGRR